MRLPRELGMSGAATGTHWGGGMLPAADGESWVEERLRAPTQPWSLAPLGNKA
jgi:hypothetical protein